jgi:hypothetical protein
MESNSSQTTKKIFKIPSLSIDEGNNSTEKTSTPLLFQSKGLLQSLQKNQSSQNVGSSPITEVKSNEDSASKSKYFVSSENSAQKSNEKTREDLTSDPNISSKENHNSFVKASSLISIINSNANNGATLNKTVIPTSSSKSTSILVNPCQKGNRYIF